MWEALPVSGLRGCGSIPSKRTPYIWNTLESKTINININTSTSTPELCAVCQRTKEGQLEKRVGGGSEVCLGRCHRIIRMDFASILPNLGLGGEFLSPVGKEIEQATSESLVNPDWALNMQICDQVRTRRLSLNDLSQGVCFGRTGSGTSWTRWCWL